MENAAADGATYAQGQPLDAEDAIDHSSALVLQLERLCSDFACPDQARAYGSNYHRAEDDASLSHQGHNSSSVPRKGSLRVFAQQVVEKVSQKGSATYQSIADELIAELQHYKRQQGDVDTRLSTSPSAKRRRAGGGDFEDDGEKNVRRRVYDSLNVLKAVGAVVPLRNLTGSASKDVIWAGLPASPQELQAAADTQDELKTQIRAVQQTQEQMQALVKQYQLLCDLTSRNAQLRQQGRHQDNEAVIPLPFVLLQSGADAVMDVKLSKDEHSAVIDFGSKAFQVIEDYVCLQMMLPADVPSAH